MTITDKHICTLKIKTNTIKLNNNEIRREISYNAFGNNDKNGYNVIGYNVIGYSEISHRETSYRETSCRETSYREISYRETS